MIGSTLFVCQCVKRFGAEREVSTLRVKCYSGYVVNIAPWAIALAKKRVGRIICIITIFRGKNSVGARMIKFETKAWW